MQIVALEVRGFRGLHHLKVQFENHCVLIGPNGSGKTAIMEALSLALGRDRLVRRLTEHDFHGSTPAPADRIKITVTLTGFPHNAPESNETWFRADRAVEKWWKPIQKCVVATKETDDCLLCVQVGFAARFDHEDLQVETVRYFVDDDDERDPFDDDTLQTIPAKLLADVGFFLVPAQRTWDRLASFESELFRRVVRTFGALPAADILKERDRLRTPDTPLETTASLAPIVAKINEEITRLMPDSPRFQLRLTGTDTDSLLEALVPHFQTQTGTSIPAGRHGSGLLALQTLILLLEFGRARKENGQSFILGIEEPELHLPPPLQRRAIFRSQTIASQTLCTSHSPYVASFYEPRQILVLNRGQRPTMIHPKPLRSTPLALDTPNGIRKLLLDNRFALVNALMHEAVLIPEGRTDYEFLRLLTEASELTEYRSASSTQDNVSFGAIVGVIPTHDAAVIDTYESISGVRRNVAVLVDGDAAGDGYIQRLLALVSPPSIIIQWPSTWTIENVIAWICEADATNILPIINVSLDCSLTTTVELQALLLRNTKDGGRKGDYLAYQEVVSAIMTNALAMQRATSVLDDMRMGFSGDLSLAPRLQPDAKSNAQCKVLRWQQ